MKLAGERDDAATMLCDIVESPPCTSEAGLCRPTPAPILSVEPLPFDQKVSVFYPAPRLTAFH